MLQSFVQSETARTLLQNGPAPVVEISEIKGRKPIDMVVGVSNFETAYAMTMHPRRQGLQAVDSSRRRSTATTACSNAASAITPR